ncbi:WD40-repeat-containing domain protein [Mycena floridula]|nr:WD40-repeat-containing domain protein [Mycena floridula]
MSSSIIYNHRSLQPSGPPASGPSSHTGLTRLNDSFESIRQEFDILASDLGVARAQRDEYETKLGSQVNELDLIRRSLYELETQHTKIRQQYEEELSRLRTELHAMRQGMPQPPQISIPGAGSAAAMPGPPSSTQPGPPTGAAAPFPDPYYSRDRDRDGREVQRDRERDRHEPRDRDRELRDRDRPADHRDPKRFKTDRVKPDRPDLFSPSLSTTSMPKLPPPGNASASASGPAISLPQHPGSNAYPGTGPPSATSPMAIETAQASSSALVPVPGGFPDDLDPHNVPPELKREGSDWFAIFNPKVKRVLDVQLIHTLMHESVVCCVRFSHDGKYLATGCNRTAQIYDVKTGVKTCVLTDEGAGKAGDLYIRSVCFSADGKYLATGAEDKQIRIWDIAKRRIRNVFDGHQQEIYSLDFSSDGRLIVSGSGDKTARIWDMTDGTSKVLTINDPDSLNNDAGVTSVAISPNGQLVAAGSLDTVVRIWDVASGSLVERLRGHRDSVYSVAFTPDGKGLISGSLDKTLKYWDVSGLAGPGKGRKEPNGVGPGQAGGVVRKDGDKPSQCTMNFTGHKDYVLSVAVSHDGQWVVSGSKDRGVQFWDSRTAIVQCMLQGHKNSVISIDLSPAGNLLASGSGDWQARIWGYSPF